MIPWPFDTKEVGEVRSQVDGYEDRSAAIVVGSLIEDQLLKTITSTFAQMDASVYKRLFKGTAPLGSFSAKLDIGFLLGFYSMDAHQQLHRVRDIRNKFAHTLKPLDFKHQEIKDVCNNLPTGDAVFEFWTRLIGVVKAHPEYTTGVPASRKDVEFFEGVIRYFHRMDDSYRDRYIIYTESWTMLLQFVMSNPTMLASKLNLRHP